jgi:NADH dehydrogenase FAD-containing subunit
MALTREHRLNAAHGPQAPRKRASYTREVVEVDIERQQVVLCDGRIDYDTLVLATGSSHHYFGNESWRTLAPGLKTVEDATEIRRRIFLAFETAERSPILPSSMPC